jgi:rhomboid family GlyGly-CTERM serine protease
VTSHNHETWVRPRWIGAIALVMGITAVCQLLPDSWQDSLRYDRQLTAEGQVWRLLTACFVHLGWAHLALNAAGLLLMSWIFAGDWPPYRWLLALVVAGLVSTLGVHLGNPRVFWLVGLSGALHGLFAFGAIGWIRMGDRTGWALLAGLAAKIVYEQIAGGLPVSAAIVGGAVVEDAHLWGVAGGVLAAGLDALCWRQRPAPL